MEKEIINSENAPAAVGPYSQAVRVGNLVYTAGQIGIGPAAGSTLGGGVAGQTEQALRNLDAVLRAAGTGLEHVIKTTVFLTDMAHFQILNQVYGRFFGEVNPPARSTVEVAGLPLGAVVEIEAVALIP
jgi:2-iminobutanoate/2-iminopropanoate deaminase